MPLSPGERDRALGAFVGLAVGDAVGTTLEFTVRDTYPHITDMVGGGPFRLPPGGWTDDTSMALALADSLTERGGFDPSDVMARWVRWHSEGAYSHTGDCFDIGIQTREALSRFARTGELPGPTESAGNGAIMRLAPVVLFAQRCPPEERRAEAARLAAAQARLTHNNDIAAGIAGEMGALLADLIAGGDAARVGPVATDRRAVRADGFVRHSWDAARWAVATTGSFRDAVLSAANLGEDADTTAAIAGQIAGALYGLSAIPETWRAKLLWRDRILASGESLLPPG
jgi:ADP-ribosyl-[dinitrogen reductase] hydrolase